MDLVKELVMFEKRLGERLGDEFEPRPGTAPTEMSKRRECADRVSKTACVQDHDTPKRVPWDVARLRSTSTGSEP